jgi:hypothetical protein
VLSKPTLKLGFKTFSKLNKIIVICDQVSPLGLYLVFEIEYLLKLLVPSRYFLIDGFKKGYDVSKLLCLIKFLSKRPFFCYSG